MGASLVRTLFAGPVDIVGDVHGEFGALQDLLSHLDYDKDGIHPQGRRLGFVGDLTDRGPENLSVINLVQSLVNADPPRAQITLGNHELNILLGRQREGNDWFFAERAEKQQQLTDFFRSFPLALERADLRVVHACWDQHMIDLARRGNDAVSLFHDHAERIKGEFADDSSLDEVARRLRLQNENPVKILTSGPERRSAPFAAGGRVRQEERIDWWASYTDGVWCVFGHYAIPAGQPHFFGKAICVDFGGGYRALERSAPGFAGAYKTRLAAARFPECTVMFDNGSMQDIAGRAA